MKMREHFDDAYERTERNHEDLGIANPATANGMRVFPIQVGRN
jgi:hypothetical protein